MTIAIGLIASDGIVIAADREESIPQFMKTSSPKISAIGVAGGKYAGACAVTGAGPALYLDAFGQKIRKAFAEQSDLVGDELEAHLGRAIHSFYHEHVLPFAPYPSQERPDCQMLIGCERPPTRVLLATDKTAMASYRDFVAVGTGQLAATSLLRRLYSRQLDVVASAVLAAYVVYHVKENVDGCGKFTDVTCFRGQSQFSLIPRKLAELDLAFGDYGATVEPLLCQYMFGGSADTVRHVTSKLRSTRRTLLKLAKAAMSGEAYLFTAEESKEFDGLFEKGAGVVKRVKQQFPQRSKRGRKR